jgi:putative MATE family efflux protein|tara:strand:- start:90216 stop:91607 length:1392 start_codon:yes stop_codon:yes gene_type:complete
MPGNAKLVSGSIRRHLWEQTAPMLLGVASIVSVGIVDAYFVGQLGPAPLAAISFVFPVTLALTSLGVGVLVGINSVVARALGAGDSDLAACRAVQGVALAGLFGLATAVLLYLLQDPIFALMGAKGELPALIEAYMFPFACGFPFLLMSMGANGVLRAQGLASDSAIILGTMATANWLLDPLLIAGWGPAPALGIAGAAYASAISFVLAGAVGLYLAGRSALGLHPSMLGRTDWKPGVLAIAKIGGPAALSNSINPVGLSILTALLANFGDATVAAFGVAGRIQTFAVVPLLAMSSAIGAIVGQNWGAGQPDRSRLALREASLASVIYGLAIAALLVAFRDQAAGIFSDEPSVIAQIGNYLKIAAWGFAGYGIVIVTNGALNAVDRATTAMVVSIVRVAAVMIPAALIGRALAGETGIYAAELAANLIGAALSYFIGLRALSDRASPPAKSGGAQQADPAPTA